VVTGAALAPRRTVIGDNGGGTTKTGVPLDEPLPAVKLGFKGVIDVVVDVALGLAATMFPPTLPLPLVPRLPFPAPNPSPLSLNAGEGDGEKTSPPPKEDEKN